MQDEQQSSGFGGSVLDKYTPYFDVIPDLRETIERLKENKKKWKDAVEVIRSLGGDVKTDNPLLNEP